MNGRMGSVYNNILCGVDMGRGPHYCTLNILYLIIVTKKADRDLSSSSICTINNK